MLLSEYRKGAIMNKWTINQSKEFQDWFDKQDEQLKEDTVESVKVLQEIGPSWEDLMSTH